MELISREDLLYGLAHYLLQESPIDDTDTDRIKVSEAIRECMRAIEEAPTIESRPKGEWLDIRCEGFTYQGTCSVCDRRNDIPHPLSAKYCPNCGAEMRSEE